MPEIETPANRTRRVHSVEFKRRLVALSLEPNASVAAIALNAGVNANLLFRWRHMPQLQLAERDDLRSQTPVLLPVKVSDGMSNKPPAAPPGYEATAEGTIEIELGGARVRLRGSVDPTSMRCVLQTLRELA